MGVYWDVNLLNFNLKFPAGKVLATTNQMADDLQHQSENFADEKGQIFWQMNIFHRQNIFSDEFFTLMV